MAYNYKTKVGKPPKLKVKAGSFYRNKKTKEIVCVRIIYRRTNEPHVWLYVLEDRKDLGTPATNTSALCAAIVGEGMNGSFIIWEPLKENCYQIPGSMDLYMYGSWTTVKNQKLINEYELISSGEIVS